MRVLWCGLLGFLTAGASAQPPAGKLESGAEVKWARGIADDFWRAMTEGKEEQAAALLSPELAKSLADFAWAPLVNRRDDTPWSPQKWLAWYLPTGEGVSVVFDSADLSPDRNEVVLRGRLTGEAKHQTFKGADLIMRVSKDAAGKWGIRYVLAAARKEADDLKR
jgi:hypothetical protein